MKNKKHILGKKNCICLTIILFIGLIMMLSVGKNTVLTKEDNYQYSLTCEDLKTEKKVNEVWINDGFRYIATVPYGVEGGDEFKLYLPGKRLVNYLKNF